MVESGVTVGDRYRVERLAGSGAAAEVWSVVDIHTGRRYALKVLSSRVPQVKRRFLREGHLARRLAHPNVVRVVEAIDEPSCLVLEWVDGPTLAERLASGPVSLADAERWFRGIAEAVGHAHAHGVVHRDLKPANILLAGDVPKVTDFGIARDLLESGITATGTVLGTPWYMAPEQVRSTRTVDHRADVFALGVILYELVLGVRPFQVDGLIALYQAHQADRWARPETLRADLPRRFCEAIAGALAIDPAKRTASVSDLLLSLGGGSGEVADALDLEPTAEFGRMAELLDAPLGREGDLAAIRARLLRGDLALVGPAGIGKTHLGRAVGGLFVSAGGATDAAGLRRAVARAAGVALAADPAESDARIAARLADFDAVVVDGAEDCDVAGLIDAWRSGVRPSFLLTGRQPFAGMPTHVLGPLPPAASRELLLGRASLLDPEGDLAPLLARLAGNPLAIELASACLGRESPAEIAVRLSRSGDWWGLVPHAERKVLGRLSVYPSSFSEADARAILGQAGALERLAERGLLRRGGRGLIIPHGLRARALAELEPSDRAAAERSFRERVVAAAGTPWAEWVEDLRVTVAWGGLNAPRDAALLAARVAVPLGLATDLGTAWDLVDGPWTSGVADPDLCVGLAIARSRLRRLLGQAAAPELVGPFAGASPVALRELHRARCAAATPSDALIADIDRSLAAGEDGEWWTIRGVAQMRLGRDVEACGSLERALAGALDPATRVDALVELGAALGRNGRFADAQVRLAEATAVCTQHGMRLFEGRIHKVVGAIYAASGQVAEAERALAAGQRIARAMGDVRTVCTLLATRAELAMAEGRTDQVFRLLARALPMAERAGEPALIAWLEVTASAAEEDAGRAGRAEARARRAVDLSTRAGNVHLAAIGSSFLTALLADADRVVEAEAAFGAIPSSGLGPVAPHRQAASVHLDLARARRGDRTAANRARDGFAALSMQPSIDLRYRLSVLATRVGALRVAG